MSFESKTVGELTVAELLQILQERASKPQTAAKRQSKPKSPDSPKKEVSEGVAAWNLFVGEVLEEMKSSDWTHPETGKPATRKDAMAEASKRKAEGNADYAAASAARRAKREEFLAKKKSPSEAPVEAPPQEKPTKKEASPEAKAAAKAKREAKKATSVPAPVVAAPPPPPEEPEEEEWIRKTIKTLEKGKEISKKYLWNPSNNHLYRCEPDGSQGEWAGLYNPKTGKIDDSVEEPQE
jgi:hypothetical protein